MCKENFVEAKELAIKEDEEFRASLLYSKKPVSSKEIMCKEAFPAMKELAIKEDGEVWASLFLS
eukprot:7072959-Ditylum_brightwellii.AAC.1